MTLIQNQFGKMKEKKLKHRYEKERCEECHKRYALCDLCWAPARHFVDDKAWEFNTLYLCDEHVAPWSVWFGASQLDSGHLDDIDNASPISVDIENAPEVGAYCPTDDCACDSWR